MFLVKKRIALLVAGIVSVGFCFSQSSVWKVSKGENTLYLAGSIHFLRPSDYPLPLEYETAFEKSDKLILETDLELGLNLLKGGYRSKKSFLQ